MATCVAKPIINTTPALAIINNNLFNNCSFFNPHNIDDTSIIKYLYNNIKGSFDISYNTQKLNWIANNIEFNNQDQIELLTIHIYDDAISERKEERSMKNIKIIGVLKQNLKSTYDYLDALKMITSIESFQPYFQKNVIPIIADWPGQYFIQKILTHYYKEIDAEEFNAIPVPDNVGNFVPIIGPLHISLNFREQVILIHYSFFEKFFHYLFGEKKIFAKKPKPWRINLLLELIHNGWKKISQGILLKFGNNCQDIEYRIMLDLLDNLVPATLDIYAILFRSGQFNQYFDTVFRLWTFALRWKRKNYNKAPLAFISDYLYWQQINHPLANIISKSLVNFNDYFVENFHSRLRANININYTSDHIIEQSYLLDMHNNQLFNAFRTEKTYPYKPKQLDYLTKKSSLFLLEHFQKVFQNLGKSRIITSKNKKVDIKCFIATLNETLELKCLPTGYHTAHLPLLDTCDYCKIPIRSAASKVYICGHSYHDNCYNLMESGCRHCLEYYKKGIFHQVKAFKKGLKKIKDEDIIFDNENTDDINDDNELDDENNNETEENNIDNRLQIAINNIDQWIVIS